MKWPAHPPLEGGGGVSKINKKTKEKYLLNFTHNNKKQSHKYYLML